MLVSKDHWQIMIAGGALDLTFAFGNARQEGGERQIRSTRKAVMRHSHFAENRIANKPKQKRAEIRRKRDCHNIFAFQLPWAFHGRRRRQKPASFRHISHTPSY
jgi:hypothetical protein